MKTSVALCTYNGARFILEQLESIAGQTHLPDEVLVFDDCSTDGTLDIVGQFAAKAPFKLLYSQNQLQLGVAKNFERAISSCTGDVIFLCDQDDVWFPEKVATMLPLFIADERVGLVFSNALVVDSRLNPLGYTVWDTFRLDKNGRAELDSDQALSFLIKRTVVTGATAAFRATLREKILPISPIFMHDAWIVFVAASYARITSVDVPLIMYRQHDNNVIGGRRRRRNLLWEIKQTQKMSPDKFEIEILQSLEMMKKCQKMENSKVTQKNLNEIQEKIQHLQARQDVFHCGILGRIRIVVKEIVSLRYLKFSRGLKSALTDLIFRGNQA